MEIFKTYSIAKALSIKDDEENNKTTLSKSELAWQYSPNVSQSAALNRLNRWIKGDAGFYQELVDAGYHDGQRILTPRQVGIIYQNLGSPREFLEYDHRFV